MVLQYRFNFIFIFQDIAIRPGYIWMKKFDFLNQI